MNVPAGWFSSIGLCLVLAGCGGSSGGGNPIDVHQPDPVVTTVNFNNVTGGSLTAGSTVSTTDQIASQFKSTGLLVSSSGGFAAAVQSSTSTVPPNALAATNSSGQVSYNSGDTITFTFQDPKTGGPAAVQSFKVDISGLIPSGGAQVELNAFDIDGNSSGGEGGTGTNTTFFLVGATRNIHTVVFTNRNGAPGVVLDNVKFSKVIDVKP